ncbi:phosphoribosylformylglycinamidine cyclo-ligase [Halococcus dombrowskii]|uniref:phosphoribosylformylglycinamidine cyclo-ligase n=1 Tax=Halococcus dombrowskii TaxID=179637 RepID=A0AAX3AL43_HALDO|nr:phosphoribosylformylglycinamidine cyclo-ligase [Halococcus dombrowskii]UOO94878.1 phosphoribosylformylglycinamidine cyclo-ligase [Halococcus dombrowskii]
MTDDADEGLTYAGAGVDIGASEAATAALVGAVDDEDGEGDYAGLIDIGGQYLALATDGVGTKLLVAEAVDDYSTVGIDCIAMNANDLVAAGVEPVAFVDYLAVDEPDEGTAAELGAGLATGAERADVALVGGETAVMPEVIRGLDIAGTCAGLADESDLFAEAEVGDALVGIPSSGIHSNGLTLAREAATRAGSYDDPFPDSEKTVGEVLLEPTRIYTGLPLHAHDTHAAAHVTGGGWTNLERMGPHRYEITDPLPIPSVFEFVADQGGVADEELYRTFNMGMGFVAALAPDDAAALADATDGEVVGRVTEGTGVAINGLELD